MRTAVLVLRERELFQNLLNTSSKMVKSSTLVVRILRKLRKTSSRSVVSMICNAVVAVTTSAGVTESPCALNSRPKTTSFSTSKSDIRANPWQLGFEGCDVALVFQKTPERLSNAGHLCPHDLQLLIERRIIDPVIETTPS